MSITIQEMQKQVFNLAKEKGWWPMGKPTAFNMVRADEINFDNVNVPEKLMLMVEELGEALGHYRGEHGLEFFYSEDDKGLLTKPDGFGIELADCVIRIMDFCGAFNMDLEALIKLKHEFNKTRPYRHGGKKC